MSPVVTQLIASRPSSAALASLFSEGSSAEVWGRAEVGRSKAIVRSCRSIASRIGGALLSRVPREDLAVRRVSQA